MRTIRRRPMAPTILAAACSVAVLATGCSPGEDRGPADDRAVEENGTDDELLRLASIARGFPTLRDTEGRLLARGEFAQWVEEEALHMRIVYVFEDGRRIEEVAVFGLRPGIVQSRWTWDETVDGAALRRFEVDFERRTARGEVHAEDEVERFSQEELDIEPGRAFAGFAFTMALKSLHQRLVDGETVELQAVGITPEPRVVGVEVSHAGRERIRMADRTVTADRFVISPQIPFIVELVVEVPDNHIWLTEPPAEFLRSEGPLLEPDDPVVRIDLLPGGGAGLAKCGLDAALHANRTAHPRRVVPLVTEN